MRCGDEEFRRVKKERTMQVEGTRPHRALRPRPHDLRELLSRCPRMGADSTVPRRHCHSPRRPSSPPRTGPTTSCCSLRWADVPAACLAVGASVCTTSFEESVTRTMNFVRRSGRCKPTTSRFNIGATRPRHDPQSLHRRSRRRRNGVYTSTCLRRRLERPRNSFGPRPSFTRYGSRRWRWREEARL